MKRSLGISVVIFTAAVAVILVLRTCAFETGKTVQQVQAALDEVFHAQPHLTINEQVIETETKPISELAVVSKDELVSITLNQNYQIMSWTLPLTEKTLTATGTYRAKAGFDLQAGYSATYAAHHLTVSLPAPKILSIEKISPLELKDSSGYLNPTTDTERSNITDALATGAKEAAEKSDLFQKALIQVKQQLQAALQKQGLSVEIEIIVPSTVN